MIQTTRTNPKKPPKKGKVVSNIVCGVIAALMLIGAIVLFAGRAQNRVIFIGNKAMLWIMTPSMQPLIEAQSYIQIEKVTADEVVEGDVITFYSDDPAIQGKLNTHEVVAIKGEGADKEFVTKGLNNPVADSYTAKADRVVGRYVKNLSIMTVLMRFFLTKAGLFCVLLFVALLTLALCLPDLMDYFKEKKAQAEAEKQAEEQRLIEAEVERLKRQAAEVARKSADSSAADSINAETDPDKTHSQQPDADHSEE